MCVFFFKVYFQFATTKKDLEKVLRGKAVDVPSNFKRQPSQRTIKFMPPHVASTLILAKKAGQETIAAWDELLLECSRRWILTYILLAVIKKQKSPFPNWSVVRGSPLMPLVYFFIKHA